MTGQPASIFERHPRTTLVLVVTILLAGTDVVATRIYALFRPDFYRQHSVFRVKSDLYHHGFKPNTSVDLEYWGPLAASYRINSLGLRDAAVRDVPLRSDKRRILFIGDSFTEGIGVPYEKTFVGIVGQKLAPRGIEVLNAGAASYCPIIDYRRVRHLVLEVGLHVDELVVFIDIGDIQDETTYALDPAGNVLFKQNRWIREDQANWSYRKPRFLAFMGLHNLLRKNTLVASTLYDGVLELLSRGPARAAAWTLDERIFEQYGREGLARAEEHMDLLAQLAARQGIRLTVGVYPWPDQVRARDLDSRQARFWREWAARRGAGFIDCFPTFMEGDGREMVKREYIRGDIHWNEVGHARVARAVLDYFER